MLIDGDILVYQAISAAQQEIEFEEGYFTYQTNIADAQDKFQSDLQSILTQAGQGEYTLCLSDPKVNWRKSVYLEYKSNRKLVKKPLAFKEFRQWVQDSYKTVQKPTLEADDVIGILATKPGNEALIWSIDKDLMQIPGDHLINGKRSYVSHAEGDYFHLKQTLTGDAVDGYPGCPGVGPVKAEKLIETYKTAGTLAGRSVVWEYIVKAYEKAGLTEADALVQARVARICRWNDWDQAEQRVRLWTP